MLHDFLTTNRDEILSRTRARVATRAAPKPTREELNLGIPLFFDELVAILRSRGQGRRELNRDATQHGEYRQQMGFTVAQVVRDYGDLCQVITELAIERRAPIATEDFKTLNGCLDDAIAQSVTEFVRVRERSVSDDEIRRLAFFAHELRNLLQVAHISYNLLRTGTVAIGGSTGALLGRSLQDLEALVNRTLVQVRLDAGIRHTEPIDMAAFLEEVEVTGSVIAKDRGMSFSIERGEAGVAVEGDRQLLGSAVSNLLQNALKFSHENGHVQLRASATPERVLIEVEDECGGLLRPDQLGDLSEASRQTGKDKSGLGLGIAISKRAIESMGGSIRARNQAGSGCVFTIDLPRLRQPIQVLDQDDLDISVGKARP
jgi:signal transduction histidine kinase